MDYTKHRERWKDCQRCLLKDCRRRVVLARGKIPCKVLFIGEAPGTSEDVLGRPFVGPAGKLMDRIVQGSIRLSSSYSWAFTNLVGCIPALDGMKMEEGPPKEAIMACRPRLKEFIALARPRLIVCVGRLSAAHAHPVKEVAYTEVIHPAAIMRMDVSQRGLVYQQAVVGIADAVEALGT